MTCIACYLVVDEHCPHCHELMEKAKDFVELLKNKGCAVWNLTRWGYPANYYDIADNDGGMWNIKTPMLLIVVHGEGGDRVIYKHVIDIGRLPRLKQYILDDVALAFHRAHKDGIKKCYERRGRKASEKKRVKKGEEHE